MIALDSSKFKPHNPTEALWQVRIHEIVDSVVQKYTLPIVYLRLGRQKKSFGSTGVRSIKIEWRDSPQNTGVWLNGYHMQNLTDDYVEKYIVRACLNWSHTNKMIADIDKVAMKLAPTL